MEAPLTISFRDIVETILKKNDIHEGIWALYIEFKFGAINAGTPNEVLPSLIAGVNKIGIIKSTEESTIAFDAAKLNPARTGMINSPATKKG